MIKILENNDLIGKEVTIKTGMYKGEWGIINYFDGDYYHIGLWGSKDSSLVFDRSEFTVKKTRR